jgi:hypothetical protein
MVQPPIEITRSGKESSLAEEQKRRKDAMVSVAEKGKSILLGTDKAGSMAKSALKTRHAR